MINNHHRLPDNIPMIAMETANSEISLNKFIFLDSRQDTEITTPGSLKTFSFPTSWDVNEIPFHNCSLNLNSGLDSNKSFSYHGHAHA